MSATLAFRRRVALAICPELAPSVDAGDLASTVAHMPVWRNGRRPAFWEDLEVRAFITASHRQMTIAACRDRCRELFGAGRTPSTSAIHRYWSVLDAAQSQRKGA